MKHNTDIVFDAVNFRELAQLKIETFIRMKMSIGEIAVAAGVTRNVIRRLRKGALPSLDHLGQLSHWMGLPVSYWYVLVENAKPEPLAQATQVETEKKKMEEKSTDTDSSTVTAMVSPDAQANTTVVRVYVGDVPPITSVSTPPATTIVSSVPFPYPYQIKNTAVQKDNDHPEDKIYNVS